MVPVIAFAEHMITVTDYTSLIHILGSEAKEKLHSHNGKKNKAPHLILGGKPGNILMGST